MSDVYKKVENYSYSPDTMKAMMAVKISDIAKFKNSIREGDSIVAEVMSLSVSPESDKRTIRKLTVVKKYPYIMKLWDSLAKKYRYKTYVECFFERIRENELLSK